MSANGKSAYPVPVEDLMSQVRARAVELGRLPSRNRVMSEFKVGAPKARAVLAALAEAGFDPVRDADTVPVRRLRSVPSPAPVAESAESEVEPADESSDTDGSGAAAEESPQVPPAVDPVPDSVDDPAPTGTDTAAPVAESVQADSTPITPKLTDTDPQPTPVRVGRKRVQAWPVLLLALPAFVAIWSGWVGLGGLTGFGVVHPLPGIWDEFELNTAITLPIGMETYAAYALRVWLSGSVPRRARQFAKWSAIGSLLLGALGQVAYHLMEAAGVTAAPWLITTVVACIPVAVLGMGAALAHLMHADEGEED